MKRFVSHIICITAILAMTCSCEISNLKKISVSSAKLESIVPKGFTTLSATASANVNNPGKQLEVSDIQGSFFYKENKIGTFTANNVLIVSGQNTNVVEFVLRLEPMTSPLMLLSAIGEMRPEDLYMSASARIRSNTKSKGQLISIQKRRITDFVNISL